jgi:hypothetical protein
MARKRIQISKTSYNSSQYNNLVDSEFTTFTDPVLEEDNDTIEELFRLYNKLYFSIPTEGEEDSHEFLIKKSSELVKLETQSEDIQPLLDEISQLRQQLLDANEQIFELQLDDES